MHIRIGAWKLLLFILITAVVNADRMKEVPLACDINVRCVALDASFGNVSCEQGFVISVINAHYGYHDSNRNAPESCSIQPDDCLESVPLNSRNYYRDILNKCNNKTHCDFSLVAKEFNDGASCDGFTENDYVSIQFYCVPSDAFIETKFVCGQGTIDLSCSGKRVIQIVGAILGFQSLDDWLCEPGPYKCRIQPDLDHLEDLRFSCQGKQTCDFEAVTSISRVNHTCDSLEYTFETVTYYCTEKSGPTLVTGISECTSAAPSTVPVTSVTHSSSSLSASSTTGGATITSEASTYTMIDSLGNVSTIATNPPSPGDTTGIIVGCVVGGVVLIILLLLLIFIVWRRRNSEDTSKRRGNSSDKGVNGLTPNGVTTMVKCDTPQSMTHSDKEYDATPLSDNNNSMPTYSLGNHPATALYDLAQDLPQPPVYWLAQEPSIPADTLAREPLADFYSEVEDLAEEPYLSLYSNSGFSKEIGKSNAGIYVNVTEPSNAAYSLVQKTNSSTHQKVEDPVGSAPMPVNKFKFTKVKIDKEEEKVSALTRHQAVQRPENDLVLRDNSLYVATETHTPNDAVDELTLTENDLYV